jgi:hypothetical protein
MRENRSSGSEGGVALTPPSLPLSLDRHNRARVKPGPPLIHRQRVGVETGPPHRLMEGRLPRRPMEGRLPRRPLARVAGPSKTSQSGRGGTGASIRSGYRGGVVLEVSKFAGR